ncbi:unnamed protein product [Anisakis simplex]|uniref:Uncharacterized protein n=1 Tax=Anisakis simplex TaxID=6269 RepID=A0A0M3JI37_ANISI|nr:unnamed protein product [Anisakis simplex]
MRREEVIREVGVREGTTPGNEVDSVVTTKAVHLEEDHLGNEADTMLVVVGMCMMIEIMQQMLIFLIRLNCQKEKHRLRDRKRGCSRSQPRNVTHHHHPAIVRSASN